MDVLEWHPGMAQRCCTTSAMSGRLSSDKSPTLAYDEPTISVQPAQRPE